MILVLIAFLAQANLYMKLARFIFGTKTKVESVIQFKCPWAMFTRKFSEMDIFPWTHIHHTAFRYSNLRTQITWK